MSDSGNYFQKEDGTTVPGIPVHALEQGISFLCEKYHLTPAALAEGPAYSLAMVVRYALGLSAQGGLICGMVRDTLAGSIAINCLRHLKNAGSDVAILVLGHAKEDSLINIQDSLRSAEAYGMNVEYWNNTEQNDLVIDIIQECHNIIFGSADITSSKQGSQQADPFLDSCVSILNELSTPVHCVLAPSGVNLETGELVGERLFASSTMALGAPLTSLLQQPDLLGRLYVSDLSLPRSFYSELSKEFPILFDEQPIIPLQIRQSEAERAE